MRFATIAIAIILSTACDRGTGELPLLEEGRQLDYTAGLTIGDDLSNEHAEFGRVSGVAVDAKGRIYVADMQANEVRVFSPTGAYQFKIGRAGAGPGEFSGPCCLAIDKKQQLWVRDGGNARYSVFTTGDTAATYVTQFAMQHRDVNLFAPTTFESTGQLIDIGSGTDSTGARRVHRFTLSGETSVSRDILLPVLPPESTAMKTVSKPIPNGSVTMYAYQPYGPQQLVAHGPDGTWAHATNVRYAIDWRGVDGWLLRHLSGDLQQGPALSARERERGEKMLVDQGKRLGVKLDFAVPGNKPVLRDLFFDAEGRLWVELTVPDGSTRHAHVYNREGRRVAEAHWPAEVDASAGVVRGDTIWGIATDSLGVESIKRLHPSPRGR